jgi:hypothetical protein
MNDHGLDLSRPEEASEAELQEFRDFYERTVGYALPAFEPWIELRPDVLKRYRLQVWSTASEAHADRPLIRTLCSLHYYVVVAYEDGILYEMRNAAAQGASRSDILETVALAFMDSGPRGQRYVATGALDFLRNYEDPASPDPGRWPAGWAHDPGALAAGLDHSTPELLPGEYEKIAGWYERVSGEVPGHVELLGRLRPNLLKASRNRFEHATRDTLPAQAVPFLLTNLAVARGSAGGAREAVLMGRGLGLDLDATLDAIAWGLMFGGTDGVSAVQRGVGEELSAWAQEA